MSASSAVLAGRRLAESLMTDRVSIRRPTSEIDDNTGLPVSSVVYAGKGKVQTYEAFEKTPDVGGSTVFIQRYSVHIPAESYAPAPNDVVEVVYSEQDRFLVGRTYVVQALLHKSKATSYRLLVDDNNGYGGA